MRRIVAIAVMLTTLLSLSFNVMADNSTASVLVNTEIRFEIDGNEFIPRETDGSRVYPLSYNDRTYIPARFIAEAVGLEVSWDEGTQTVGFTTKNATRTNVSSKQENIPQKFYVEAVINQAIKFKFDGEAFVPKEADGTILYPLTYKDRTYIPARFIMERAGIEVTWDEATQTVGFNTVSKPVESEKVDDPLSSTEKIANGVFPSMASVREEIEKIKLDAYTDTSNGSITGERKAEFRERAMKAMILCGFDFVIYNDYDRVIVSQPSYADVYAYYMKNAKGKTDVEILKHLTDVYGGYGLAAIELTTLVESPNFGGDISSVAVSPSWYEQDADPNQNEKYIFKHISFPNGSSSKQGMIIKNISSGALLLDSNDSGSIFTFKSNVIDANYMEMLKYYIENKLNQKQLDNNILDINNGRIEIFYLNGEYAFRIK